jgi:hypothetical protein
LLNPNFVVERCSLVRLVSAALLPPLAQQAVVPVLKVGPAVQGNNQLLMPLFLLIGVQISRNA